MSSPTKPGPGKLMRSGGWSTAEIEKHVWDGIRATVNKFREEPLYFFTEADITSYLWKRLFTRNLEYPTADGRRVFLVHQEYPTNFRYEKAKLLEMDAPYPLSEGRGCRGNFDVVVLNPDFVAGAPGLEHIVNKNVRDLQSRYDPAAHELLFAMELKYVINNNAHWVYQIRQDNKKLEFASQCNVKNVVNLVFCNTSHVRLDSLIEVVQDASSPVCAVFVQSYDEANGPSSLATGILEKHRPLPITNGSDVLARVCRGRVAGGDSTG